MNNTGEYRGGGVVEDNNSFEIEELKNERITIYLKWANKVKTHVVVVHLQHNCFITAVTIILCAVVEVTPT